MTQVTRMVIEHEAVEDEVAYEYLWRDKVARVFAEMPEEPKVLVAVLTNPNGSVEIRTYHDFNDSHPFAKVLRGVGRIARRHILGAPV